MRDTDDEAEGTGGDEVEVEDLDSDAADEMMDCIDRRQRALALQNKCSGGSPEAIVLSAIVEACDEQIAEWADELGGEQ